VKPVFAMLTIDGYSISDTFTACRLFKHGPAHFFFTCAHEVVSQQPEYVSAHCCVHYFLMLLTLVFVDAYSSFLLFVAINGDLCMS
jgi:hypothetical protein